MTNTEFESKLAEQIENLPKEIQPRKDLWKGIDYALEEPLQQNSGTYKWYAVAASVMFVVLLSWNMLPQSNP